MLWRTKAWSPKSREKRAGSRGDSRSNRVIAGPLSRLGGGMDTNFQMSIPPLQVAARVWHYQAGYRTTTIYGRTKVPWVPSGRACGALIRPPC